MVNDQANTMPRRAGDRHTSRCTMLCIIAAFATGLVIITCFYSATYTAGHVGVSVSSGELGLIVSMNGPITVLSGGPPRSSSTHDLWYRLDPHLPNVMPTCQIAPGIYGCSIPLLWIAIGLWGLALRTLWVRRAIRSQEAQLLQSRADHRQSP